MLGVTGAIRRPARRPRAGRVLTRAVLIDRIWGADYVGDTNVHIKRLRAKVEIDPLKSAQIVTIRASATGSRRRRGTGRRTVNASPVRRTGEGSRFHGLRVNPAQASCE